MPMKVVRPKDLSDDTRQEICRYLHEQWERAVEGRAQQVDQDYDRWDKNYRAEPVEAERSFPWRGASNMVVPLIRMHHDTFVARTLGIVYATQPLLKAIGFPEDESAALEKYLNYKALYNWDFYKAGREFLDSGNRTGTATMKTPWIDLKTMDVMPGTSDDAEEYSQKEVTIYSGPRPEVVPFEDFYVYPITATRDHHIQIRFHRNRYTSEEVKEMCDSGKWQQQFETTPEQQGLEHYLRKPDDIKRQSEQSDAGVTDYYLYELQPVECHFRYNIAGTYFDLVAQMLPEKTDDLLDLYFNPYPRNIPVFQHYRPFPRSKLWYGESLAQILEQAQEECSKIHNDRRNNSYIANAPIFKVKKNALVPNPSTTWYPGKAWVLEDMDDMAMEMTGRNYDNMIDQEGFTMQLAERLTGIGAIMQGMSQGSGKRGNYSTGGTIALMQEGNERQNTNIRDYREALAAVGKSCFILQRHFDPDDPAIAFFPKPEQDSIRAALQYATPDRVMLSPFEIRTSTSAMNKDVERQNLMQMAQVMNNYYGQINQMAQQLLNPQLNAGLRMLMNDIVAGQKAIASRLLRAFDEMDPEGVLPDVSAAIEKTIPGGSQGSGVIQPNSIQPGGSASTPAPLSRAGLQNILSLPGPAAPGGGGPTPPVQS